MGVRSVPLQDKRDTFFEIKFDNFKMMPIKESWSCIENKTKMRSKREFNQINVAKFGVTPHTKSLKTMHTTLRTFAACLLTSASLLASPHEEANQTPAMGHKRSLSVLGIDDSPSSKKQRGDLRAPEDVFPLGLLPADALRIVGDHLGDRDLLSLAHVNSATRETLVPQFLLRKAPTRVWLSGLEFDASSQGQKDRYTFVGEIMPDVMEMLLLRYKKHRPRAASEFRSLLTQHGSFKSQGKTLKQTPLWKLLRTIKGKDPKGVNPEDFYKEGPLGDGDRVFLNLLHYVHNDFKVSPARLPGYVAQEDPLRTSPQARKHVTFLKDQLSTARGDLAKAKIWDEILEISDILDPKELTLVANIYSKAAQAEEEVTSVSYHLKSTTLWDRFFETNTSPAADDLKAAAHCYRRAAMCQALSKKDREAAWSKSAKYWVDYVTHNKDATPNEIGFTADTFVWASRTVSDPATQNTYIHESAKWWVIYLEREPNLRRDILLSASVVFQKASNIEEDRTKKGAYLIKGADAWNKYIAAIQNPDEVTAQDLIEAATFNNMAGPWAPEDERKRAYLKTSVSLWKRCLDRQVNLTQEQLKSAAITHYNLSVVSQDDQEILDSVTQSVRLWARFLDRVPTPQAELSRGASRAFFKAANLTQDPEIKDLCYTKSAILLDFFVARPETLRSDTLNIAIADYERAVHYIRDEARKKTCVDMAERLRRVIKQREHQPL